MNLLLTECNGVRHYSTIKQFSRLVGSQYTKNHLQHFYCYSCLHGFKAKKGEKNRDDCILLQEHLKYCKKVKPQRVSYPQGEDTILKFKHIEKQLKAPFVCYADFECMLKPQNEHMDVSTGIVEEELNKKEKKSVLYQVHKPASYAYKIVSIDPNYNFELKIHQGEDAADHFITSLQKDAKDIFDEYIKKKKPMPTLTAEEQAEYDNATDCHICGEPFLEGQQKDRDHCHILGVCNCTFSFIAFLLLLNILSFSHYLYRLTK